jgi:hypothetical protein
MIGRILTIENGKVVIDENVLLIPELKAVNEAYPDPIPALNALYQFYHPESAYQNITEEAEREAEVLKDNPGEYNWNGHSVMLLAREKMQRLCHTPTGRFLKSLASMLDKISLYMETTDVIDGKDGNLTQILSTFEKSEKMLRSYHATENAFKNEVSKNRGEARSGYDEDGEEPEDY